MWEEIKASGNVRFRMKVKGTMSTVYDLVDGTYGLRLCVCKFKINVLVHMVGRACAPFPMHDNALSAVITFWISY